MDKRADIWAFGCVLFECLTGKRAFPGDTSTETVAAILRDEPDWALLPAETPAMLRSLLRRCLQKDPRERLHDVADVRIEIAEASRQPSIPKTVSTRRPGRGWILGALVGAPVLAVAAALITWHLRPPPSLPVVRSLLRIEAGQWLDGWRCWMRRPTRTAMAVARDGSFIVYSAVQENPGPQAKPQIYLRRMDHTSADPIAGTEGGISPFLSPDGRRVGFWEGGKLNKVRVSGAVPTTLCDGLTPFGFDWGPDNTIVFSPGEAHGLYRVSAEGGKPEVLTVPDKAQQESSQRLPRFLPGGRGVLFTVMSHSFDLQPRLAILDFKTRKWRFVMEDAADSRWLQSGVFPLTAEQKAAFTYPAAGESGTSGRNTFRGPEFFSIDLSLVKLFRISENQAISLRAEAYNALNNTNFGGLGTSIAVPANFGKFSSTVNSARVMQMALR